MTSDGKYYKTRRPFYFTPQPAGWGLKIGAEHGGGSQKQSFGFEKRVDKPSDRRKIAETTSKTQFDTMNIKSNGKSWIKPCMI